MFDIILKQLGLNPAEIKKQVDEAPAKFNALIEHFNARLDTIEKKQDAILLHINGRPNVFENTLTKTDNKLSN